MSRQNFKENNINMSQLADLCCNKVQVEIKENNKNMSQPKALCRNKVQAEIKEEIELYRDKDFFYRDIAEEECEKVCRDTLYSVLTLIKANGRGTLP